MRASAKLCQIVMLISMAIFHAFNAPAWCEESKATDCESLLDSTETAPLERITSDYLRCLVNAKMMNDFTPLAAVNNQIETAEQSRAKITYDPAKQETFWAVTIKDEHGLSQGDQDRVAERLKSILNDALEDSDVLTPEDREQVLANTKVQFGIPRKTPALADDAERDETPTDNPFSDEAPTEEEQLAGDDELQKKKPTGDSLADDAGGDKKLAGTRIPPKDTPLEEPPDSARVDELTGPMIEKMLKETINSGDEDDPDIPLIKDYLDPDSIQVVHNPQTRETEISILTRDGRNLTQQKDADLQAAVKNLWEHILERDVSSADDEHNGLVKGTSVDLGPNRIGPKPLQPNVKIVGEKADNGSTLTITAELDKPALEDSSVNVAVQVGGSPRTLTIAIPQGNSSEKVEVRMPDLIRNVITTGRPPRGEHVAFVSIIRVEGVAEPSLGEGGFAVVLGGTSTPSIDTVSHKTQAIEACNVCEPVTYCPTCRRRLGRR